MECKVLLRFYFKNTSFQPLLYIVSLTSVNNINNNLEIGDWVKNTEKFQKNEDGE